MSLKDAKRGTSDSFVAQNRSGFTSVRKLNITARTAGASKTIEADVDKPLGLTLGQKPGGGVVITVGPIPLYVYLQLHLLLLCTNEESLVFYLFLIQLLGGWELLRVKISGFALLSNQLCCRNA